MRQLIAFVVLAYLISWSLWLPLIAGGMTVIPGALPSHLPGLMGPAFAALMVTAAGSGRGSALRQFLRSSLTVNIGFRGLAAASSAVIFLGLGIVVARLLEGHWPDLSGLGRYSGVPAKWPLWVIVLVVFMANGLGEELGWRGFALPRLQARFGTVAGSLLLFPIWALWHLPNFFFLANFMEMSWPAIVFGWGLGLFAGTMVLANVAHLAHGSALATALWHTVFNFAAGTDLGPFVPAVTTTAVMLWAIFLCARLSQPGGSRLIAVAGERS